MNSDTEGEKCIIMWQLNNIDYFLCKKINKVICASFLEGKSNIELVLTKNNIT